MSFHLSVSSVELQQTVSDVASFVCVCLWVRVASSIWVTFVGQGVAGHFVCSLRLSAYAGYISHTDILQHILSGII